MTDFNCNVKILELFSQFNQVIDFFALLKEFNISWHGHPDIVMQCSQFSVWLNTATACKAAPLQSSLHCTTLLQSLKCSASVALMYNHG